MPTMPPEAANRSKPKVPYAENNFMDLPKPIVPKTENRKLLKGQKAIVTGASSGIGRSIALALGHAGAAVYVNYVAGEDKAQAMVDELRGHGHTAISFRADVSSETEVVAMFDAVRDEFGTVDILVNNAGLQSDAPFDQMTLAQWNKVICVNLTGQFLCAREAVREFKRRGVRPQISCCAGKIILSAQCTKSFPGLVT
jgi:glucose 1-dehydrogenase